MTFAGCVMWQLFTARDILAFAGAAVCGLLSVYRSAPPPAPESHQAGCPVCLGSVSQVTEPRGHSGSALIQSCLASDKDSLCLHAWFARLFVCLFACLLVCVEGIFGRNPEIERMAQLWSVFRRFCPSSECPCVWFVMEQGSMAHTQSLPAVCTIFIEGHRWLSLPSGSPPAHRRSRWHWLWNMDTPAQGARLQTEIHYSSKHTDSI